MAKYNYKIEFDDLNLENITEGLEVDSYVELCNLLGIEPKKGGASRKAQQEQILQYINFEKISRKKIKINEIYLIPNYKNDGRKEGNNTVYRDDFIGVLAGVLLKSKSNSMLLSRGRLIENLGFVNKNYRNCRSNTIETAKKLKIPEQNILDFYMMNSTKLAKNVDSNLDFFESEEYFRLTKATAICINEGGKKIHRLASKEEDALILYCRDKVKQELNLKTNSEIFIKNLWNLFNAKVNEELKSNGLYINYYYKAYYFVFNRAKLEKVYKEDIKDKGTTLGKQKNKINDLYKESSLKSADTRQKNALERICDENVARSNFLNNRDDMLSKPDYLKNNKKLVNNLISHKANAIQLSFLDEEISPYEGDDE